MSVGKDGNTAAFFCATYLKPEMHHVHRQICGLKRYTPVIIAQKTEGVWPGPEVEVVKRSPWRFVARYREKQTGIPWQMPFEESARVVAAVRRTRASLLHVFFGNVAVHMREVLRGSPVPVVVSFHGSDVAGGMATRGYQDVVQEIFQSARLILCRSDQLAGRVKEMGCPTGKIRIMRTVLPDLAFQPREFPPDGSWRLVLAARLVPKKGIATALRAFVTVLQTHPKATLTIAGEGPTEQELRRLASPLGESVRFTGFLSQEDLQKLFAQSHLYLQPSETAGGDVEGIPNAMLEAMASGLPVVATRHGGIPEVVVDGGNGFLCTEKDAAGIATAILKLTADETLIRRLSRVASESVRAQFSADSQIAAIESLYDEARR